MQQQQTVIIQKTNQTFIQGKLEV